MLQRLFGKRPPAFESNQEFLANFMLYNFMEDYWGIPKSLFVECSNDVDPQFRELIRSWLLIYCAWLFRGLAKQQFDESIDKDMMAAVQVRLLKPAAASFRDVADALEYWFAKLDAAISAAVDAPTLKVPNVTIERPAQDLVVGLYSAAMSFVVNDPKECLVSSQTATAKLTAVGRGNGNLKSA